MRAATIALPLCLAVALGSACSAPEPAGAPEKDASAGAKTSSEPGGIREAVDDAAITAQVKTAFLLNRHLEAFKINVDTTAGEVTLRGVVESKIQKDLAGEIAQSTNGVKGVRNELTVAGPGQKIEKPDQVDRTFTQTVIDSTITASVKTAFRVSKSIHAGEIGVSTRWGTVTLTGNVGTEEEKRIAEQVARNVEGVRDVDNRLKVVEAERAKPGK